MRPKAPDVAVVGGGLIGLCSALALQRAGLSTLLIDDANERAASLGNAGHIAVEQVQPLANPAAVRSAFGRLFAFRGALDFRTRDVASWGGWALRYLAASTAERALAGEQALQTLLAQAIPAWRRLTLSLERSDLLVEGGHLVVWERETSALRGRSHWQTAPTGEAKVRELSLGERSALVAALGQEVIDGLGFDGTAQVAGPRLAMDALTAAFVAAGGDVVRAGVRRLERRGDAIGLRLDGDEIWPDQVVMAAGVGSGPLMRSLGQPTPIVAERGYHIEAQGEAWGDLPPVVFEDRSLVVTRFGGRLRATSFVEFARADASPDPRKWARLERHAQELGLPMRGTYTRWVGSRPTLPDYLPAIGRNRRASRLIYAFGHQHLGLTLAPLTGELVASLALGAARDVLLHPFDLDRFGRTGRPLGEASS